MESILKMNSIIWSLFVYMDNGREEQAAQPEDSVWVNKNSVKRPLLHGFGQ
jgi:hypothetical protein